MRLVGDELRLPDGFHHAGQSLDGTGDKIQRNERQQPQEPPGMVHVEKVESLENLEFGLPETLQIFLGVCRLRDDGTDDRSDGKQYEGNDRQLEGAEKVPDYG